MQLCVCETVPPSVLDREEWVIRASVIDLLTTHNTVASPSTSRHMPLPARRTRPDPSSSGGQVEGGMEQK